MVTIKRSCTIVSFRARADVDEPRILNGIRQRITTFKGTLLGTADDGFDLIAAFNTDGDAMRFLNVYFEGELDGPIGVYEITDATI